MADINDLEQILSRLEASSGATAEALESLVDSLRGNTRNVDRFDDTIVGFNRNMRRGSFGLEDFGDATEDAGKKAEKFGGRVSNSFSRLESTINKSGSEAIKDLTDGLGNAVSSVAEKIPLFGGAISAVTTTLTGLVGVALGFADKLADTNRSLYETGVVLEDLGVKTGGGIDEFVQIAGELGISGGTITKAMELAGESFAKMGGGGAGGLRRVTDSFAKLQKENTKQLDTLYKLGYTTEDVMAGMADFGATAKMAGVNLSTDQLAEGAAEYLKVQREITRLTGEDVKAQKAKQEALKTEAAFQAFMAEVGPDSAEVLAAMNTVPEGLRELVKKLLIGGEVTSTEMALIRQQMGEESVNMVKALGETIRDPGQLQPGFITAQMSEAVKVGIQNIDSAIKEMGSRYLSTISDVNNPFSTMVATMGLVNYEAQKLLSAMEQDPEGVKNTIEGAIGEVAKGIIAFENTSQQLQAALFTAGVGMTNIFGEISRGLLAAIGIGSDKIQEVMHMLGDSAAEVQTLLSAEVGRGPGARFDSEEEKRTAIDQMLKDKLGESMGGFASDILGDAASKGTSGIFGTIGTVLKDAITDGLETGFDRVLDNIVPGYETSEEEIDEALNAIKEFGISSSSAAARLSELDETELSNLNKLLSEQGLGEVAKEKQIVEQTFGTRGGMITQKVEKDVWTQKPQPQALGGIFDYKPGGEIVRVAEASDEIVAPAKRGADGKLGLEVSGAMFDKSMLLQSLVKINESQAAMISGLNSQMASMNTNFEKLVYEQRQANRLAV
jgi:uncharacterized protein YukE